MVYASRIGCLVLGAVAFWASPAWSADLNNDLAVLTSWFSGEFDNFEQVAEDRYQKLESPHQHLHSVFAPVEVPTLGDRVFYVQQSLNGDSGKIYRQRLYSFAADPTENAVVMRIFKLDDESAVANAHLDTVIAASIQHQVLTEIEGCEVLWTRQDDTFIGKSRPDGCKVVSAEKTMIFRDEVTLRRDSIEIKEWAVDGDGATIWGGVDAVPSKQRRCTLYDGWVVFKPEGSNEEYQVMRGLKAHDQGYRVALVGKDGTPSEYVVELASLTYEKSEVPVLKLSLFEVDDEGDHKVVYTWNQTGADQIGFNLGWAQAGFSKVSGQLSPELKLLRDWMKGSFSSRHQSEVDPENFHNISLQMAPIWTDRDDAYWLYVEQAVADQLEKPYRQRVYRLSQVDDDLFESTVFSFDEPLNLAGSWREDEPLKDLTPDDLSPRTGCSILLRWTGNTFEGSTLGRLCQSSLRGSTFATSEVVISPGRVVSWDRGFDDSGQHIWGAEKSGYQFLKD